MALKKLAVNVDETLIEKIDIYANSLHINRTAAVSVLLSQALETKEGLDVFKKLLEFAENQKK